MEIKPDEITSILKSRIEGLDTSSAELTEVGTVLSVADGIARGTHVRLVADDDAGICGTVQLLLGLPENQPHRADVAKMLVLQRARRRGVGEALMRAVEDVARDRGKTLLTLDTASDSAMRLYERTGWTRVGTIPDFALLPQGGYCATVIYYRRLDRV